jgi:hypothetical protein
MRGTTAGTELVRLLTAADLDGWAVVERLKDGLAPLREHPSPPRHSAASPPPTGRGP